MLNLASKFSSTEFVDGLNNENKNKVDSKESVESKTRADYQEDRTDDFMKLEDGEYIEDEQEMSME